MELHNNIYTHNDFFFWTAIKKIENFNDINNIIKYINNIDSKSVTIIDNNFETLADPFYYKYNDDIFIFFEKINKNRLHKRIKDGIGEIYYTMIKEYNNKILYTKPEIALSMSFHLSYPQIFKEGNDIYMMPEQNRSCKLDIYICKKFPDEWEFKKTLLHGKFYDSTFFKYDKYYIFTIEQRRNKIYENLYYSDSLFDSEWKLMKTICNCEKKTSRRGAGNIFILNNKIYRPVQSNKNYYGEGIDILEITINDTNYIEKYIGTINRNIHTLNIIDNYLIIDSNNKNKNFFN